MPKSETLIREDPLSELSVTEQLRVAPMEEASRLSGVSVDTLNRHYAHLIRDLSPRRKGMRVIHALTLPPKK